VLRAARERFAVSRLHIAHRLGSVGVTEASILVCAVAPHRRAAFEAAEWMLEEVKREAQIWKKECYANADADAPEWKANRVDNERWHAAKEQQLS
jgi:molybdopterin synthase catalytic subunit